MTLCLNTFGLAVAVLVLLGGWWAINRQITRRELELDHKARLLRIREKRLTTWSAELDQREQLITVAQADQARTTAAEERLDRAFGPTLRRGDR